MYECSGSIYVYYVCTWCLRLEEGMGPLGTGVTDTYEPLYECLELTPGLQQE